MAQTRFHTLLRAKIEEELTHRASELAMGVPLDQYQQEVGFCRGLKEALVLCEEIEKEFD